MIAALATLNLGGQHLMLISLTGRLEEGQTFSLDLHFEKAGIVKTNVTVKGIAARTCRAGSSSKPHARHSH